MKAQKYLRSKFFLVLMMCGVATAAALLVGGITNVHAVDDETDSGKVTVYYRLYSQRILEINANKNVNYDAWDENMIWYTEEYEAGEKVSKEKLNQNIIDKLFTASDFLTEEDKQKINNQHITWYVSERTVARENQNIYTLSRLKNSPFDFSTPLEDDIYLEGVLDDTVPAPDTKWMFWAILAVAGAVILVGVIMAVVRNRSTRLTLDNKRLMTEDSKNKLEEIKDISSRKDQYSPLNDNEET